MARGKGEGGVYQRGDGLWCVAVELPSGDGDNRRRKIICRKDKNDALGELRKAQNQLAKTGNLSTRAINLEAWLEYWSTEIAPLKIRPKTLAGYRTVIDGHISPELGKKPLSKITPAHVRQLHKRIETMPKDPELRGKKDLPAKTVMLSGTYALLAHNVLSTALKSAIREGHIHSNPCEMVDKPRKRVTEQHALTVEESVRLLRYCAANPHGTMWATFLLTGARRGEILGLEVDRVTDVLDLSWQLQRIGDISKAPSDYEYRELGGTLYLTRPKSSAGWRVIPLVEPLKSMLQLHIGDRTSGLVFANEGRPWDPDRVTKLWKEALGAAKLPTAVVLHGLRHTTVDLLYAAGVPEAFIMEIVGHSSRAVTRGYRSRGNRPMIEDAMSRVSALLAASPGAIEK